MPFEDDALNWLLERAVRTDGRVLSWHNPEHPGFAYPEAAGFVLHLLSYEGATPQTCDRVAAALAADVDAQGGLGKEGRRYAFDAAVALAALTAHRCCGGAERLQHETALAKFVARLLWDRRGVVCDGEDDEPDRWSRAFGTHLIKAAARLGATAEHHALAAQTIDLLEGLFDGERFPIHAGSTRTYAHAHAYALEGLLLAGRARSETFARGVAWLAAVQQDDGGIPPWHDDESATGPARSDVTAQAIRLWCVLDRKAFGEQIERGLAFLEHHRSAEGGVLYESGSADASTWCTVFAVQAHRWAHAGAFDPTELI